VSGIVKLEALFQYCVCQSDLYLRHKKQIKTTLIVSFFLLEGCSTFYLHNESEQKAMESAISGYQEANTAQIKALDEQGNYLAAQMKAERTAIVNKQFALRDNQLAQWIDKPNYQSDQKYGINIAIGERASYLLVDGDAIGGHSREGIDKLNKDIPDRINLSIERLKLQSKQRDIDDGRKAVSKAIANYEAANGTTIKYCDKNGQGLSPPAPETDGDALELYNRLSDQCSHLAEFVSDANEYAKKLGLKSPFWKVLLGKESPENLNGALYQTARRAIAMKALIDTNIALQKTAKSQFELLEKQYQCELKNENTAGPTEQLKKFATQIKEFSDLLDKKDLQDQLTTLPDDDCPDLSTIADTRTCGNPNQYAIPDLKALLCRAGVKPKDLKKAIGSAASNNSTASLLAGLREGKEKFSKSQLGKILAGLTNTKPGEAPEDKTTKVAIAVVDALTPLDRLKQVHDGTLPDTPSTLIELARAEYVANLAAAESDKLKQESDTVSLQLQAMINEVDLLHSAINEKDKTKKLRRYSDSWTIGRLQQDVAFYDLQNLKYEASLVREKAAVTANQKLLEPALVQLDTYAKGGWTTEDFKTILHALSTVALGFIAGGVN
jgi:hypothetical protein